MLHKIGARGAHTGAEDTCLRRLQEKYYAEFGVHMDTEDMQTEACMSVTPCVTVGLLPENALPEVKNRGNWCSLVCYRWGVTRKSVTGSQKQSKVVFPGVLPLRCYPEKCYPQSKKDEYGVPPCITPAPMLLFSAYSESYPGQHGL